MEAWAQAVVLTGTWLMAKWQGGCGLEGLPGQEGEPYLSPNNTQVAWGPGQGEDSVGGRVSGVQC